jgi:hypothetical protein
MRVRCSGDNRWSLMKTYVNPIRALRAGTAALALAVAGGALGLAEPAHATVVIRMDDAQLTHDADAVVHGVVTSQRGELVGAEIYTYTTLKVANWVKGQPAGGAQTITLRQMGGAVNGLQMAIPGDARLATGDEVVVFLRKNGDIYHLTGMQQSRFVVQTDAKLGKVVTRPMPGLALASFDAKGKLHVIEADAADDVTGFSAPSAAKTSQMGTAAAASLQAKVRAPESLGQFIKRISLLSAAPRPAMPAGYRATK